MRWICINGTHINTHQVATFFWRDGKLWVWYRGEQEAVTWEDPDRVLYVKMCHAVGTMPYEEDDEGGEN